MACRSIAIFEAVAFELTNTLAATYVNLLLADITLTSPTNANGTSRFGAILVLAAC